MWHFLQPTAVHQRIISNQLQQLHFLMVGLIQLSGEDEVVGESEEKGEEHAWSSQEQARAGRAVAQSQERVNHRQVPFHSQRYGHVD